MPTQQKSSNQAPPDAMQGEGNRSADRNYRNAAKKYADSGKSEPAAKDAERAIDGDEQEDLKAAERAGKSRARATEAANPRAARGADEADKNATDDDDDDDDDDLDEEDED